MKEEELKKIISKSTVATSDDFLNHLMHRIDTERELKKASFLGSFKSVLIACSILGLITKNVWLIGHVERFNDIPFFSKFQLAICRGKKWG